MSKSKNEVSFADTSLENLNYINKSSLCFEIKAKKLDGAKSTKAKIHVFKTLIWFEDSNRLT